jgi:hypothetical protein
MFIYLWHSLINEIHLDSLRETIETDYPSDTNGPTNESEKSFSMRESRPLGISPTASRNKLWSS